MKAVVILIIALYSVECRKIVQINKNANVDFINMEGGGSRPAPGPSQPVNLPSSPTQAKPVNPPTPIQPTTPTLPATPKPVPKPVPVTPKVQPTIPPQSNLKPAQPVTTPGPGSVKQLVTFYDSQGKGSVIRPYSYSEAVKKGRN